jgi:proteasome lid subunit RPN8/RPN11
MQRPDDTEFFWLTRDGMYLCRNHLFFQSDVPARRMPRWLAEHRPTCRVMFPLLGVAALEYVVGFFGEVYRRHGAEAIVLVLWDLRRKRYRLCVPPQEAKVWESHGGLPRAIDVTYRMSASLAPDHLLVGDIHSHADLQAYSSGVDKHDEQFRDGVHVVVGRIDREPPEFHLEMTVDDCRFTLKFGHFFRGYRARRRCVPEEWLRQVKVEVSRSTWVSTSGQYGYQGDYSSSPAPKYRPKPRYPCWDDEP